MTEIPIDADWGKNHLRRSNYYCKLIISHIHNYFTTMFKLNSYLLNKLELCTLNLLNNEKNRTVGWVTSIYETDSFIS